MAESNDSQKRVTITLNSASAEDDTNYDPSNVFYAAGGAATGPRSGRKRKALVSDPVWLHDRWGTFEGEDLIIFDDNVYVDDFIEIGLQFRTYTNTDFGDRETQQALTSALTPGIGTAVESLPAVANGAVAGAILAATSPAMAIQPTTKGDTVLGTAQTIVNVADLPDGSHGYEWKYTGVHWSHDGGTGEFSNRWWKHNIFYSIEVQPVAT